MSDRAKTGTPIVDQERFTITWRDAAYYVSIPNYGGGEVVPYKTALTLEVRLRGALDALSAKQSSLTEALKVAGEAKKIITWAEEKFGDGDFDNLEDRNNFLSMESCIHDLAALERIRKP